MIMYRFSIIAIFIFFGCSSSKEIVQSTISVSSDSTSIMHRSHIDSTIMNRTSVSDTKTKQDSIHIRDSVHVRDSIVLFVDPSGAIVKKERYHDQRRYHDQNKNQNEFRERTLEAELNKSVRQINQLQHENKALQYLVTDYQSKMNDNAKRQRRRSRAASVFLAITTLYFIKKSLKKGCS